MLFGQAYGKAASVGITTKRFEKSDIFPFNSQTHDESNFLPADVCDRLNPEAVSFEKESIGEFSVRIQPTQEATPQLIQGNGTLHSSTSAYRTLAVHPPTANVPHVNIEDISPWSERLTL